MHRVSGVMASSSKSNITVSDKKRCLPDKDSNLTKVGKQDESQEMNKPENPASYKRQNTETGESSEHTIENPLKKKKLTAISSIEEEVVNKNTTSDSLSDLDIDMESWFDLTYDPSPGDVELTNLVLNDLFNDEEFEEDTSIPK